MKLQKWFLRRKVILVINMLCDIIFMHNSCPLLLHTPASKIALYRKTSSDVIVGKTRRYSSYFPPFTLNHISHKHSRFSSFLFPSRINNTVDWLVFDVRSEGIDRRRFMLSQSMIINSWRTMYIRQISLARNLSKEGALKSFMQILVMPKKWDRSHQSKKYRHR